MIQWIVVPLLQTMAHSNVYSQANTSMNDNPDLNLKRSFDPIIPPSSKILILGTLPGDESLRQSQYYAHPRNRFWKVIAAITRSPFPINYEECIAMLHRNEIALWDVAHRALRKGSLDSEIKSEETNDIASLIEAHGNSLHRIVFNGKGAEKLYSRYFPRYPRIDYLSMPSTSPANAAFSLERLCEQWRTIL